MRHLGAYAAVLLIAASACAPLDADGTGSGGSIAAASPSLATDAVAAGKDPFLGRRTVTDVWGHTTLAPGEDTGHGGSTTWSLGVQPPGIGGGI